MKSGHPWGGRRQRSVGTRGKFATNLTLWANLSLHMHSPEVGYASLAHVSQMRRRWGSCRSLVSLGLRRRMTRLFLSGLQEGVKVTLQRPGNAMVPTLSGVRCGRLGTPRRPPAPEEP